MTQNNLYKETYSKLIESNSPVAASGWGSKSHLETVYLVKNITDNLTFTKDDVVADIGCGSGLLTIPIAGQVKKIFMGDFIPEMVDYAKDNCQWCDNVEVSHMDITNLSTLPQNVDIVIANSVIQSLGSDEQTFNALNNIYKILNTDGEAFLGCNANDKYKQEYIDGYDKLNLTEEELETKKRLTANAWWVNTDTVTEMAQDMGFEVTISQMPSLIWQSWYMFNIHLKKL